MKILAIVVCAISLFAVDANALTEQEYQNLTEVPHFKQADRDLSKAWNDVYSKLSGEYKKMVLSDQRKWVKNGRDRIAEEIMKDGVSFEEAYTIATYLRIGNLYVIEYNNNLSESEYDSARADGYYSDQMYSKAIDIIASFKSNSSVPETNKNNAIDKARKEGRIIPIKQLQAR